MKTVYMLTQGAYSDYSVVGIYSTEAKATAMMAHLPESRIEEIDLDRPAAKPGCMPYIVQMDRNGTVHSCRTVSYIINDDEKTRENTLGVLWTEVWAKSNEHATKIANERRAQFIAQGVPK